MATTAAVLDILVKANTTQANAALGKTQSQLRNTERAHNRMAGVLKKGAKVAGLGVAAGFGLAAVAVKDFVGAAQDAQVSDAKMRAQLKASGISYAKHADQINKVIQKTSQLSGLDDEDLQDSFTNIVRVTGDVNKSLKLTGLAADFARAKHIDVAKAGELVGKVAGGNTGILARYGIKIKEGASATEALGTLQKKFAGQAKAYGDTSAGAQDKFRVAVENLKESIGAKLLPIVTKITLAAANFVNGLISGTGAAGGFGEMVGSVFGKIKNVVGSVIGFLSGQFKQHRDDIKRVGEAVQNVGKLIVFIWQNWTLPVIKRVLPAIVGIVKGAFNIIGGIIKVLSALLTGRFGEAWKGVKQIFRGALQVIGGIIRAATAPFREAAAKIGGAIGGAFGNAWDHVKDKVRDLRGWLADRWEDIRKGARSAAGGIKDAITFPFRAAVTAIGKFVGFILKVVDQIPGVNLKGPREAVAKFVEAHGLARGGAFARTGGKVRKPMVFMGEEAPRHPEFVIPTNPAYRKRARGLLAQAAGSIGFAGGGMFGFNELADLWTRAKGPHNQSGIAAAVALAESGGNPAAHNPSGASGLWQILGQVVSGNIFDPFINALNAVKKFNDAGGWSPWEAFTNGSYKKFLTDAVRNALSPGDLVSQLPGLGGLPDWMQGTGKWALDQAKEFIRSNVGGIVGGGAGIGGQTTGTWKMANTIARKFGLRISSNYRTPAHNRAVGGVEGSLHTHGSPSNPGAFDFVGAIEAMNAALLWARKNLNLKESLIHDAGSGLHLHLGFFRKGGVFGGMPFAGSFAGGGIVPGPIGSPQAAIVHGGEAIGGPLVHIEKMEVRRQSQVEQVAAKLAFRVATSAR